MDLGLEHNVASVPPLLAAVYSWDDIRRGLPTVHESGSRLTPIGLSVVMGNQSADVTIPAVHHQNTISRT
ncbi:hypothetical protein LshimejAT787_1701610 [Lyophyllum shimeji]|uniref:Uncharacterized protein n=1 Tax=Lyophyllum shimeji TaxID=47721 RepID=A0A9P3PZU9_LYOSH|nr:hypothetical protein LshimejAT787_1701610 [Lyophyllum shimeji]